MAANNTPLNSKGIDPVQTWKKTYDCTLEAHRIVEIKQPYNKVEYAYDCCNRVSTITYYYDSVAEKSTIGFNPDVSSSLCGKGFLLFSKEDTIQYRVNYSVCCGFTAQDDTATIKNIVVNILACDAAPVISLATKQLFTSNCCLARDFSVELSTCTLSITNAKQGEATDIADGGTGFTLATTTQGVRTTVEVLTYEYDDCGRIKCITTLSGENLVDLSAAQNTSLSIQGSGNLAKVSQYGSLRTQLSAGQEDLLCKIINELRISNVHLSEITGDTVLLKDIEDNL
jgi:hypothetical protein